MTTTPPQQPIVRSPPTPHYGAKYDDYQPYATRRSTRFLKQRAARTPSPEPIGPLTKPKLSVGSRKSSAVRSAAHPYSPPSSPQTSPQKRLRKNNGSSKHHMLSGETQNLDPSNEVLTSEQTSALIASMLPTPAKTPRKKAVQPGLNSTARILFPNQPDTVDEAMPTPRKKSKKHIGFSLSNVDNDDDAADGDIEIYTDSKNKVPELDESEDNPFYVKPGREPGSVARNSKRRKVSGPIHRDPELEEASKREDGMVYVFRGKKFFRKFPEADLDSPSSSTSTVHPFFNSNTQVEETTPRFTRSSIKPRLLFPPAAPPQNIESATSLNITDEEATTDIDETRHEDVEMTEEEPVTTPVKNTFAPATPPTTVRATRSSKKKAELGSDGMAVSSADTPQFSGGKRGGSSSPFDGWQRTKTRAVSNGKGKKRQGDSLEAAEGGKRMKGNMNATAA